jgi:predicted GH43/DUF377 family glycosyl hydrolase
MNNAGLTWQRSIDGPFIKAQKHTAAPDAVTTPDIFVLDGSLLLYIGAVDKDKERIIHMPIAADHIRKQQSIAVDKKAKVVLDAGPFDFNCKHVFDPAAILWNDRVHLYYSAIGKGNDSIGLAVSKDGIDFVKHGKALMTGRSPEVVDRDGVIHIFFVNERTNEGYSIYSAQSKDGYQFEMPTNEPVLSFGPANAWDDKEVTTPRIMEFEGTYYMVYAGLNHNDQKDIPRAFGLARSDDLVHWEKYPRNPVFGCGTEGSWDDGAIWFGTAILLDNIIYLVYEGGRLENILGKTPALTHVGLATLPLRLFIDEVSNWK